MSQRDIEEIDGYYEKHHRTQMMHCFARWVIAQGNGALAQLRYKSDGSPQPPETLQQVGRRLFGQRFRSAMIEELRALAGQGEAEPAGGSAEWSDNGLDASAPLEQATLDF